MRRATFQYLMKLHYSQTVNQSISVFILVSVPYEITLLSNSLNKAIKQHIVSVPYEITLLSNSIITSASEKSVSVPYEITLLSNLK